MLFYGLYGIGILLFVVIGGLILIGLIYFVFLSVPSFGSGNVTLECPHCHAETPAHLPACRYCGKSFRDPCDNSNPGTPPGRSPAK